MLASSKYITSHYLSLSKPIAVRGSYSVRQGGLTKGGWNFLLRAEEDTLQGSHPGAKVSTEMKTHLSAHSIHIGSITVKGQATAILSNPNLGVYSVDRGGL